MYYAEKICVRGTTDIPSQSDANSELNVLFLLAWTSCWTNDLDTDVMRRHDAGNLHALPPPPPRLWKGDWMTLSGMASSHVPSYIWSRHIKSCPVKRRRVWDAASPVRLRMSCSNNGHDPAACSMHCRVVGIKLELKRPERWVVYATVSCAKGVCRLAAITGATTLVYTRSYE